MDRLLAVKHTPPLQTHYLSDNYQYEFTSNADYLEQYASLVLQYYKKDLNFDLSESKLSDQLTVCNENEYVFIVREGNHVIGGTKLSFVKTASSQKLPMEEADFTIKHYLPEKYNAEFHGEIGRLVIDPEYRGNDVLQNMVDKLMTFSVLHHCHYLFVLAPRLNAVLYRRLCNQLQVPATIHKQAMLPDKQLYRDMGIQLLSCDLLPKHAQLTYSQMSG